MKHRKLEEQRSRKLTPPARPSTNTTPSTYTFDIPHGRERQTRMHQLADTLPENATWDDVIEETRFRGAVEAGVRTETSGQITVFANIPARK